MGSGWLDQPLSLLAQVNMIHIVNETFQHKNTKGADWSKFSPVQNGLISWLVVNDG